MVKLTEQIEEVEKRAKKMDMDMKRLVSEALEKKKAKDTKGKHSDIICMQVPSSLCRRRRCWKSRRPSSTVR